MKQVQYFTCSVFVMELRISKIVASRSCKVGYISIFSSSNVKDIRNTGKCWQLLESNRFANSSTLFWSSNFNFRDKTISRVIINIQWEYLKISTSGEHYLTWFEMRVDALLKKESSFFSFTLFSVSLLLNSWMILGSQVLMTWSSVLLQSAAIFSCRLLQSTGPELLHHNRMFRHPWMLISPMSPSLFVLTYRLKDQPELWMKMSGSQDPGQFAVLDEAGANLFSLFYGFWWNSHAKFWVLQEFCKICFNSQSGGEGKYDKMYSDHFRWIMSPYSAFITVTM